MKKQNAQKCKNFVHLDDSQSKDSYQPFSHSKFQSASILKTNQIDVDPSLAPVSSEKASCLPNSLNPIGSYLETEHIEHSNFFANSRVSSSSCVLSSSVLDAENLLESGIANESSNFSKCVPVSSNLDGSTLDYDCVDATKYNSANATSSEHSMLQSSSLKSSKYEDTSSSFCNSSSEIADHVDSLGSNFKSHCVTRSHFDRKLSMSTIFSSEGSECSPDCMYPTGSGLEHVPVDCGSTVFDVENNQDQGSTVEKSVISVDTAKNVKDTLNAVGSNLDVNDVVSNNYIANTLPINTFSSSQESSCSKTTTANTSQEFEVNEEEKKLNKP